MCTSSWSTRRRFAQPAASARVRGASKKQFDSPKFQHVACARVQSRIHRQHLRLLLGLHGHGSELMTAYRSERPEHTISSGTVHNARARVAISKASQAKRHVSSGERDVNVQQLLACCTCLLCRIFLWVLRFHVLYAVCSTIWLPSCMLPHAHPRSHRTQPTW